MELSGTAGWTFSDGVSGGTTTVNGEDFSRIDPKDAFSWGAADRLLRDAERRDRRAVQLAVDEARDLRARQHARARRREDLQLPRLRRLQLRRVRRRGPPYFLGGLGATQYGTVNVNIGGVQRDIGGNTKFSTTWALGVKLYPSKSVGIRLEGRWTPDVHQVRRHGLVVRPLLGLLRDGQRAVREPVRAERRDHPPLLAPAREAVPRSRAAPPLAFLAGRRRLAMT